MEKLVTLEYLDQLEEQGIIKRQQKNSIKDMMRIAQVHQYDIKGLEESYEYMLEDMKAEGASEEELEYMKEDREDTLNFMKQMNYKYLFIGELFYESREFA